MANLHRQRILVVDDDPTISEVVGRYLERESYAVEVALDGAEALERARAHLPDLVVLDLMLPRIDGLEVFRQLRSQSSVPVIMLTAKGEETDKLVGLNLGADDYMTKPFSPRELVARVKAVLRRSEFPRGSRGILCVLVSCPSIPGLVRYKLAAKKWTSPPRSLTCSGFWPSTPGRYSAGSNCSTKCGITYM